MDRPPFEPARVLRRPVADAHRRARQMIADAHSEAERIRREARSEADVLRREAATTGRAEVRAGLARTVVQIRRDLARHVDVLEAAYVDVLRLSLERLLRRELLLAPADLIAIAREALREVHGASNLRIIVAPDDASELRRALPALEPELRPGTRLELEVDPELAPGGCRVQSELGTIDASIDAGLDALRAAVEAPCE